MTITRTYFIPRPDVSAAFQLTEENAADAAALLNDVWPECAAEVSTDGITWTDTRYPGTRQVGAVFGKFVVYCVPPAPPIRTLIYASDTAPTADAVNQTVSAGGVDYTTEIPS